MVIFILSNFVTYRKRKGSYFINSSTNLYAQLWIIDGTGGREVREEKTTGENNELNM
jgi:hypothetical protein